MFFLAANYCNYSRSAMSVALYHSFYVIIVVEVIVAPCDKAL